MLSGFSILFLKVRRQPEERRICAAPQGWSLAFVFFYF